MNGAQGPNEIGSVFPVGQALRREQEIIRQKPDTLPDSISLIRFASYLILLTQEHAPDLIATERI